MDPAETLQKAEPVYQDPEGLKKRMKESYDAMGTTYNNWTVQHSPRRMWALEALLKEIHGSYGADLPSPFSILELGAGAGVPATERLLRESPSVHVTANDLSTTQVAEGHANMASRGLADRVSWVEGDMMTALSFPDETFDASLALYSLIHLPREEQEEMLRRLFSWLKPGGYLLANFSEEAMPGIVMEKWLHEKGWMFWSGYGEQVTLQKLEGCGFKTVLAEVKEDDVDVKFLWVIAQKP